jgi:hypothetical protein
MNQSHFLKKRRVITSGGYKIDLRVKKRVTELVLGHISEQIRLVLWVVKNQEVCIMDDSSLQILI